MESDTQQANRKKNPNRWAKRLASPVNIAIIVGAIIAVATFLGHPTLFATTPPNNVPITPTPSARSYMAAIPGPLCDKGTGVWQTDSNITLACQKAGLLVTVMGDFGDENGVVFTGPSHSALFPSNYSVQVTMAFPAGDAQTTGVIRFHGQGAGNSGGQRAYVVANGSWGIDRLKADGAFDVDLRDGTLPQTASNYTLLVTVDGTTATLSINGQAVTTVTDATYLSTEQLSLDVIADKQSSVLFSNFVYTPLS